MRRLNILHVEDNGEDARLLARACEIARLPMNFCEVPGGSEAMAYLLGEGIYADRERYPLPNVIILDLRMPGMSGFDFLDWLRKSAFASLPVLVFTVSREVEDKARALAAGASGYFTKPGDFASLVRLAESLKQFGRVGADGDGSGDGKSIHPEF